MRIVIGSDHAGYQLKRFLVERLTEEGRYSIDDIGTFAADQPVDYPDSARAIAEAVVKGEADRGIAVCGSGAGACMAAGKVPGARAFAATDVYTGHQAVEHDNANVLCLGERVTGTALALEIARAFLGAEFSGQERHARRVRKIEAIEGENHFPLEALRRQGQSVWVDHIDRAILESGELRRMAWEDHVVGMTSNPAIFEKAMGQGKEYEAPMDRLAKSGKSAAEIYWTLALEDIQAAADVMRPIYALTNGLDGYISLEVAPNLAHETEATVASALDLWRRLDRPNVMIKIPATDAGVPAVEAAIAAGVNVNVTLMFSVELYERVARAYVKGLQRYFGGGEKARVARPDSLTVAPVSVASFFVSRVDTLVDRLLGEKIVEAKDAQQRDRLEGLLGRAAIANARLAYERFKHIFAGAEWEALAEKGAQVQRPLWASTSTKNPRYRDVLYVEELIGPRTVNTVPPATLEAFKAHGRVARSVDSEGALAAAEMTMRRLAEVGIDMQAVTDELQSEGVRLFVEPFDKLLGTIEKRRQALLAVGT